MKVAIAYPPLVSPKGVPLLSQNRQFQWFNRPTYVYPMVPAYAATMAQEAGHEVFWADGIAEGWSPEEFERRLTAFAPDVCLIETKTPVVKRHWPIIRRLKAINPTGLIALCGDHVTALPEESMRESPVDFILTGGDYDFTLIDLLAWLGSMSGSTPNGNPPAGVWYRPDAGTVAHTPPFTLTRDLNTLPMIDRELTRWDLYARKNGNFRYTPGTYTMVGRDCWWGKCAFCSWTTLYSTWRTQTPDRLLNEIGVLLDRYPIR